MERATGLPARRLPNLRAVGPRPVAANVAAAGGRRRHSRRREGVGPTKIGEIAIDFTGQEGYASSMERAIVVVGSKISYFVFA